MQTLERGLAVLLALGSSEYPLTMSEIADECELPRAVARRMLLSLEEMGYARQHNRVWSLTYRALALPDAYLESSVLPAVALEPMQALARATHQSTSLAVRDGHEAVYVQRIPGRRIVHAIIRVGTRVPLHATSLGRVLLAGLTDAELDSILPTLPFAQLTGSTRTSVSEVKQIIAEVRDQDYCIIRSEFEPELITIAVPVRDARDTVIAALNLPSLRSDHREEGVPAKLAAMRSTASEIGMLYSERLTHFQ